MNSVQPVLKQERIEMLDIIRGFALFGIFIVNMLFFHSPKMFLSVTGESLWESTATNVTSQIITLFFTGRFFTIFSFLFGLGFFIFIDRLQQKNLSVSRYYSRRLVFLLLLGLFHGVVLWSGDILLPYACAGFFLLLFRNLKPRIVLMWAIGISVVTYVIRALMTLLNTLVINLSDEIVVTYQGLVDEALVVYKEGTFLEILMFRLINEVPNYIFGLIIVVPTVLAVFLFGLYVGKRGIHQNIPEYKNWIVKVWQYSLVSSILLNALYFLILNEFVNISDILRPAIIDVVGGVSGLILSFFYVSSITLLCLKSTWLSVLRVFSPVGKMALTNYLIQTMISIIIFNGYGFGLYGQVSPSIGVFYVVAIFLFQVVYSHLWLRSFKYGPCEWVWRSLTYKKKMSFKEMKVNKAS